VNLRCLIHSWIVSWTTLMYSYREKVSNKPIKNQSTYLQITNDHIESIKSHVIFKKKQHQMMIKFTNWRCHHYLWKLHDSINWINSNSIFRLHYPTNNEQFLFWFGALSPNLFFDFSQHVRFLRYSSMNLPKTLKMPLLSSFGKKPQGTLQKPRYT
jgi:hypothetical protein